MTDDDDDDDEVAFVGAEDEVDDEDVDDEGDNGLVEGSCLDVEAVIARFVPDVESFACFRSSFRVIPVSSIFESLLSFVTSFEPSFGEFRGRS